MITVLIATFALINLVSFIVYFVDKRLAIAQKRRIPEAKLLILAFLGPFGAIPGIWLIRHKTRKFSYLIKCIPLLILSIALQIFIIIKCVLQ